MSRFHRAREDIRGKIQKQNQVPKSCQQPFQRTYSASFPLFYAPYAEKDSGTGRAKGIVFARSQELIEETVNEVLFGKSKCQLVENLWLFQKMDSER
jgi:hypothetical protein